ncbi:hypothetical protein CYJ73_17365 [Gordonia terrae]|uniref:Helix-turn-helix domain-containing protein n=1 Tax=Gordonia terrae TaxID=2055 RepID=A0A2I1R5F6_9ACTN|nr:hypothetical protein CYJ73_17365 [Gordonia terrae]
MPEEHTPAIEYVSLADAARRTGVGRETIARMIRRFPDQVPFRTLVTAKRYDFAAIERVLDR